MRKKRPAGASSSSPPPPSSSPSSSASASSSSSSAPLLSHNGSGPEFLPLALMAQKKCMCSEILDTGQQNIKTRLKYIGLLEGLAGCCLELPKALPHTIGPKPIHKLDTQLASVQSWVHHMSTLMQASCEYTAWVHNMSTLMWTIQEESRRDPVGIGWESNRDPVGIQEESNRNPGGIQEESSRNPTGIQ